MRRKVYDVPKPNPVNDPGGNVCLRPVNYEVGGGGIPAPKGYQPGTAYYNSISPSRTSFRVTDLVNPEPDLVGDILWQAPGGAGTQTLQVMAPDSIEGSEGRRGQTILGLEEGFDPTAAILAPNAGGEVNPPPIVAPVASATDAILAPEASLGDIPSGFVAFPFA